MNAEVVSSIGKGILVFAAVAPEDTRKEVESMAAKVLKLKMWPDEAGRTVKSKCLDTTIFMFLTISFISGSVTFKT